MQDVYKRQGLFHCFPAIAISYNGLGVSIELVGFAGLFLYGPVCFQLISYVWRHASTTLSRTKYCCPPCTLTITAISPVCKLSFARCVMTRKDWVKVNFWSMVTENGDVLFTVPNTIAVSYTHLDVYKRQVFTPADRQKPIIATV